MSCQWLSQDVNRKEQLSWHHYLCAAAVSLLVPFLVACVQSALVMHRGYRLSFALLYGFDFRMLLYIGFWIWIAPVAFISFLILLPFLRFPFWRRAVLVFVCFGWIWFIFRYCEAVTRGYGS